MGLGDVRTPRTPKRIPPHSTGPVPVRNQSELRSNLWNAVEWAERGGRINTQDNWDLRGFINGRNSGTAYEILTLKRAIGETPPDRITNGMYTLGDRMQIDLKYGQGPVEKHTGVVWNINRDQLNPANQDTVMVMVSGKDGGAPFYVNLPVKPGAWWDPSEARVSVTTSALTSPAEDKRATDYLASWGRRSEEERLQRFDDGFVR